MHSVDGFQMTSLLLHYVVECLNYQIHERCWHGNRVLITHGYMHLTMFKIDKLFNYVPDQIL